ncbi:nuclear transport factor 2 family protein [Chitinophaga vietnamensis]|uniref:nuclear transport factor 2 family protein n=1 Tax=Chitinophaga vietnamensis TaxID=2593957 RepID=UPI001177E2E5|nr:nuclear transport factor 2 family protein [Chitinophaga vietnamensis]
MKNLLIVLLLSGYATVASAQSDDVAALKKLNEEWIHAYPKKDTATLNRILADDLTMITSSGNRLSKGDIIRNAANPATPLTSSRVDSVDVRVLGQVAIVMAKASFVSKMGKQQASGQTSYMDIYEKRNGKWVAVAAHVTSLPRK